MNNSGTVGPCQPFGRVLQKPQQLSQFSSLLMNQFAQRTAIDKFHRDEPRVTGLVAGTTKP